MEPTGAVGEVVACAQSARVVLSALSFGGFMCMPALFFYNLVLFFKKIDVWSLGDVNSFLYPVGRRQDSWLRGNTYRRQYL